MNEELINNIYKQHYETLENRIKEIKADFFEPTCGEIKKNEIHDLIKKEVNKFIPYSETYIRHYDQLKECGMSSYQDILTQTQIKDIQEYLKNKKVYNSHIPSPENPSVIYEESTHQFNSYSTQDILECPYILRTALKKGMISIISCYLGCTPTLYSLNIWRTKPSEIEANIQKYHRDYDDFKFVTVLVYLNDVDIDCGPHVFVKYTHTENAYKVKYDSNYYSLTSSLRDDYIDKHLNPETLMGSAGSTYLLDTYGIHKGSSNVKKERLALWMRYGLHKNPPTEVQTPNPIRINKDIIMNDIEKYITRLLVA